VVARPLRAVRGLAYQIVTNGKTYRGFGRHDVAWRGALFDQSILAGAHLMVVAMMTR
jgi:hypothetical protein